MSKTDRMEGHPTFEGHSRLYPLLHRLEDIGFFERSPEVVGGKVRKYFSLTDRGRQALEDLRYKIRELVSDVLDDDTFSADSD